MIDFEYFEFATTPRTGTTWFMNAAAEAGLRHGCKADAHNPFENGSARKPRVTIVRHPCDWLRSFYVRIYPAKLSLPTDNLSNIVANNFDDFIRAYLKSYRGEVGRIFDAYVADICLRTEELNSAFGELCDSVGIIRTRIIRAQKTPPHNCSRELPFWNPSLRERVLDAEKDILWRYNYDEVGACHHYPG